MDSSEKEYFDPDPLKAYGLKMTDYFIWNGNLWFVEAVLQSSYGYKLLDGKRVGLRGRPITRRFISHYFQPTPVSKVTLAFFGLLEIAKKQKII